MSRNKLTDDERLWIEELYSERLSASAGAGAGAGANQTHWIAEIAGEVGVPYSTAYAHLARQGLLVKKIPRHKQADVRARIVDMYTGGATMTNIMQECGVTAVAIYDVLSTSGVPLRGGSHGQAAKLSNKVVGAVLLAITQGRSTNEILQVFGGSIGVYDVQRVAARYGLIQQLGKNDHDANSFTDAMVDTIAVVTASN